MRTVCQPFAVRVRSRARSRSNAARAVRRVTVQLGDHARLVPHAIAFESQEVGIDLWRRQPSCAEEGQEAVLELAAGDGGAGSEAVHDGSDRPNSLSAGIARREIGERKLVFVPARFCLVRSRSTW
jgi:hypothetical protein